jgi:hypothetical protein
MTWLLRGLTATSCYILTQSCYSASISAISTETRQITCT